MKKTKLFLRKQLLLLAMVCGTTAYAQTTDYEYYDRIPQIIDGVIQWEDGSVPAWITTVDSKEWDYSDPYVSLNQETGAFLFGGPNGKDIGTVKSPNFDVDGNLTMEISVTNAQNAEWKNDVTLLFGYRYTNKDGVSDTTTVEIKLNLKSGAKEIIQGTATVVQTSTTAPYKYTITVPMPSNYDSNAKVRIQLKATGGNEIGATSDGGENKIDVYGDNLVLRDDWDNTERLIRNADRTLRKVTVVRSYTKGWYTLSLPFDLTMKQFQRRFMAGFDKAQADSYTWKETTCAEIWHYDNFSMDTKVMNFRKHDADDPNLVLEAGVPYLIYIPADISRTLVDFTGTGAYEITDGEIKPEDQVMVFTNIVLKNPGPSVRKVTDGEASFASNLSKTNIADVMASNQVYYLSTDAAGENPVLKTPNSESTNIKGFRAYFMTPKGSSTLAKQSLFFAGDDVVTAINKVDAQPTTNAPVYNMQGLRMNSDLKSLPRGMYIVNGKKYVIK